jgi:beta-phosphoglucomutase
MSHIIKGCIFDLDGVIVDTAKYHGLAWTRLADSLGVPFNEHDNEQLKGVGRIESLEYILNKGNISLSEEEKVRLASKKNEWYLEFVRTMQPDEVLPGAVAFLTELKQKGIKIALGSASKNARLVLELTNTLHLFDAIVDGTRTTQSKPHPQVFLMGAEDLGLKPSECVVFEDAISGIDAALAGGFTAIGIGSPSVLTKAHKVFAGLSEVTVADVL